MREVLQVLRVLGARVLGAGGAWVASALPASGARAMHLAASASPR